MGSEERKGVHPRGMTSAHADWHLQAQLEDDQLSLGAVLRRINPRPHHFCVPLDVKPEGAGNQWLYLRSWARGFGTSPSKPSRCGGRWRCFWVRGPHGAQVAMKPGLMSGLHALLPYVCVTFDKAQAFPVPCFPYLPIFIKSAFRIMWQRSEIIKLKLSIKF